MMDPNRVLFWINVRRNVRGRRKLITSPYLQRAAKQRATLLAQPGTPFAHMDMSAIVQHTGTWTAECLAHFPDGVLPRQLVGLWLHSTTGHRKILVDADARTAGIATVTDGWGDRIAVALFSEMRP